MCFCSLVLLFLTSCVLAAMAVLYLLCFTCGVMLGLSGLLAYESAYELCLIFLGALMGWAVFFAGFLTANDVAEDLSATVFVTAALAEPRVVVDCRPS